MHGLGDATLNGRELAVVSYLDDHVIPCLIGRDPHRIEDIWQYLYKGAYWRRGPVTMTAIAAVDTALWDIKAKAADLPLYQLLGGKSRDGVMVYGHANGRDIAEAVDAVAAHMAQGYKAIRAQAGVPGLDKVYGVPKGGASYEPADKGLPIESVWSTRKISRSRAEAVRGAAREIRLRRPSAARRASPPDADRGGAARQGARALRMFWIEDPTPAENQDAFRLIRQHTMTPIAVGEVFNSIWDCKDLIENQLIDYIRATVVHAGGITHLRQIAALAELYQVRTGCHGATDLSPVCMGAALHFDISVPNFGIQEYMRHTAETDAVFPHAYTFSDGFMLPGEAPGHGVEIDEALAAKYPYEPAYLPVARLEDGTLTNW